MTNDIQRTLFIEASETSVSFSISSSLSSTPYIAGFDFIISNDQRVSASITFCDTAPPPANTNGPAGREAR